MTRKRERYEIQKALEESQEPFLKKERRTDVNDVYSRTLLTKTHGRGSMAGWGVCPLCNNSSKRYALGRGITMHLNEVHKPWQPLKAELARRERIRRKCTGIVHRIRQGKITDDDRKDPLFKLFPAKDQWVCTEIMLNKFLKNALGDVWDRDSKLKPICYEPSSQEVAAWAEKVIELAQSVEADSDHNGNITTDGGYDRDGNLVKSYEQSLPPLLMAAKAGHIKEIKDMVNQLRCEGDDNYHDAIRKLLQTVDRNGSNAYHWAAGGGHLKCLDYLFSLSKSSSRKSSDMKKQDNHKSQRRRRDGKTCLHYAARNGQTRIIDYLVQQKLEEVDVTSGDGTTPLHLACFGGHLKTIRALIEDHFADRHLVNEWGCGIGHWIAMTIQKDEREVVTVLEYLKQLEPESSFNIFGLIQKQGHSSVHKAAQKMNKIILTWLVDESKQNWTDIQILQAGGKDAGGNKPSDIWKKMGGDEAFADWLDKQCSW